jgi:hypothetical protein
MAATKKQIIAELNREAAMRRKMWVMHDGFFVKREQQEAYNLLQCAISIFNAMTDAQYNQLTASLLEQPVEQKKLF